ncbi:hypothetical protein KUCAC02_026204 [Chaenocephalus aceratus]|uniref:Uncharacterized protein n=1 Tax=Chaenocephalus aceratus TaxID=36190 RepID=A0ACB9VX51_CHAAC|nr:hypothetical protein KUCAC02_026204 [Chaenocephalus aceratus]
MFTAHKQTLSMGERDRKQRIISASDKSLQSFGEGAHSNRTWLLGGREQQQHSRPTRLQEEAISATSSTPQAGRYPPLPPPTPTGKAISDLIAACALLSSNTLW